MQFCALHLSRAQQHLASRRARGHPSLGGQTQVSLHCWARDSQSAVPGALAKDRVPWEGSATEAYILPGADAQSRSAKESGEDSIDTFPPARFCTC